MRKEINKPLSKVDFGIECCSNVEPIVTDSKDYGDFVLYWLKCPQCDRTNSFRLYYEEEDWSG